MGFKGAFRRVIQSDSASVHTRLVDGPLAPIPFSLHPDYDRRPRDHTGSADLAMPQPKLSALSSARGLDALRAITAGGELHPALRTLPPAFLAADILYHIYFTDASMLFANSHQDFRSVCPRMTRNARNVTVMGCSPLVRQGFVRLASRLL